MAGEWRSMTLRDAGVTLIDCDHRTPPSAEAGFPYVAIPQLRGGRIALADVRRITPENFVGWTKKAKPTPHDVILSRRCNPGETAFVPQGLEFALGQNLVLLRADGTSVYPPFLRWLVRGPEWWEQVAKFINVGAVFDSLKCVDIPNFSLCIPPLAEQRVIAEILGSLDEKIELNRRMNETLEATARTLFKSWFIDSHVKAAGWRESTIGQEVHVLGGSTPSTANPEYWDGGTIHWATPRDLSTLRSPVLLETERQITSKGLAQIGSGLLPKGTVLFSSRAPIGYLAISEIPVAVNQGFVAMVCDKALPPVYVWLWVQHNLDAIKGRANGTTFQEISKSNFRSIPLIVPSSDVIERFTAIAAPLHRRMVENIRESRTLAMSCDTLLPKLLSGEVRGGYRESSLAGSA